VKVKNPDKYRNIFNFFEPFVVFLASTFAKKCKYDKFFLYKNSLWLFIKQKLTLILNPAKIDQKFKSTSKENKLYSFRLLEQGSRVIGLGLLGGFSANPFQVWTTLHPSVSTCGLAC
jgi:hypothetical protein